MSLFQHFLRFLSAFALALAGLTGCGGGSDVGGGGTEGTSASAGTSSMPTLQAHQAATIRIGVGGGSVSATADNGTTYTLTVPFGALSADTDIKLTPISNMGSAPLADGLLGAVQMEPSGLVFARQATLEITGVSPLAAGKRAVGFATANDGGNFRLNLATLKGTTLTIGVSHFSTGGASQASQAELDALRSQELAPLDMRTSYELLEEALDRVPVNGTETDYANAFRSWYDQELRPRLDEANLSADQATLEKAVDLFHAYFLWRARYADIGNFSLNFNNAFATEDAHGRPIVAKLIKALIAIEIASCKRATVAGFPLDTAEFWQIRANYMGLDGPGSGLDRSSFLQLVNQCLRVVLDPIALPADLAVGTTKSLGAKASLVFAHLPNPQAAHFEFTVTPVQGVSGARKGFADGAGRFTTTFTPTALPVEMVVRACLVLDQLGPTVGSDICASQTVSSFVVPPGFKIYSGTIVGQRRGPTITSDESIFVRVAVYDRTGDLGYLALLEARGTQRYVRYNPRISCEGGVGYGVGTGEWNATISMLRPPTVSVYSAESPWAAGQMYQSYRFGPVNPGTIPIIAPAKGYFENPGSNCEMVRTFDDLDTGQYLSFVFERDAKGITAVVFPGYNGNDRLLPE